jgi:hypothetical protein
MSKNKAKIFRFVISILAHGRVSKNSRGFTLQTKIQTLKN